MTPSIKSCLCEILLSISIGIILGIALYFSLRALPAEDVRRTSPMSSGKSITSIPIKTSDTMRTTVKNTMFPTDHIILTEVRQFTPIELPTSEE